MLDYLLWLRLKGGRQHVGEEFQGYRKQELHKRDNNEDQEGKKSEDVCTCSEKLQRTNRKYNNATEIFHKMLDMIVRQ